MLPLRTTLKHGGGHRSLLPLVDESSASAEAPSASAAYNSTAVALARSNSNGSGSDASTDASMRKSTHRPHVLQSARVRGGRSQGLSSEPAAPRHSGVVANSAIPRRSSRVRLQTFYEFGDTDIDSGDMSASIDRQGCTSSSSGVSQPSNFLRAADPTITLASSATANVVDLQNPWLGVDRVAAKLTKRNQLREQL